ncbi:MAG: thioesterase family protein [Kofleriaceae bacterium]|nr:thioesterase family protein [Kofleriaceae bacterium]MBP6839553.1 thioesterase family protein [Kofleriaceae bacterium]MBP9203501.1 thioesterase family protein [Kofleriaceae bacterium]
MTSLTASAPMTLDEVMAPRRLGPGHLTWDVADGWQQGRGAFGGLVLGTLARAMLGEAAADGGADLALRTLTGELPAPTEPGPAELVVEVLRRGSSTRLLACRLLQGGQVRAHAVGLLARARPGAPRWQTLAPPVAPAWRDVVAVGPAMATMMPAFARHFEFRVTGPVPFTRGAEARCEGWVRARSPGTTRDAGFVIAHADAYWPAAFAVLAAPRPMATVTFTIELLDDLAELDPDAPLLHRAVSPAAADGFCVETRELWGHDGRLVARNHQTFAVIK